MRSGEGTEPEVTIDVVGQKWSWTFNYKAADNPAVGSGRLGGGHDQQDPRSLSPVGKLVQFNSPRLM